MTNHNFYTDPREDMEALYPRGKNPASDYGPRRGMQEIRVETGSEPITLTVDTGHPKTDGSVPVTVKMPGSVKLVNPRRDLPRVEPRHGDSELDTGKPHYHGFYEPLTEVQKAQGLAGLAIAKQIAGEQLVEPVGMQGHVAPIPAEDAAMGLRKIAELREQFPFLNTKK